MTLFKVAMRTDGSIIRVWDGWPAKGECFTKYCTSVAGPDGVVYVQYPAFVVEADTEAHARVVAGERWASVLDRAQERGLRPATQSEHPAGASP